MPHGGSPRQGGGGGGLAGRSLSRQGIPQQGVVPGAGAPDDETLSEALKMLRGGQVGAEKFLQLLALLAGSTLPQMQQGGRQEQPRRQGRDRQARGGARGGGASIQGLLGGR